MWKAFSTVLGFALVASVNLAAGPRDGPGTTARIDEGRALFMTSCASCHGTAGRGDGPVAETLRTRPADLTQLSKAADGGFVAQRIQRVIDGRDRYLKAHGSFEMPVWGDAFKRRDGLSEEAVRARIEAIVRYLQSFQPRLG